MQEVVIESKEPEEYSVTGWFRWRAQEQRPWHLVFRLTVNDRKTNKNDAKLGDRVLGAWVG